LRVGTDINAGHGAKIVVSGEGGETWRDLGERLQLRDAQNLMTMAKVFSIDI